MTTSPTPLDDQTRAEVLRFFRKGRFANDLAQVPALAERSIDRRTLVRCLVVAGLLVKVRGATRGTVYTLAPLGEAVLALLDTAHSAPNHDTGGPA